mmetsp:Transcript_19013/g.58609  ORF Transcript_19013/g.58609 Transcript_19013/m.58609 type:complete len:106 (-) Transcript_19013:2256-2573(-)
MASGQPAPQTEETKAPERSFLCLSELDTLFHCATPSTQIRALYRDGTFTACGDEYSRWIACLRGKPVASASQAPEDDPHVWEFKKRPSWHAESRDADEPPSSRNR